MLRSAAAPLAAIPALLLSSCAFHHAATGPLQDEPVAIDLGDAKSATVQLNLAAGELILRGGASKLLQGRFEYNVPAWKPEVRSSVSGSAANITIEQRHGRGGFGNTKNLWDLELNDNVLLDLTLNCGAGRTRLELGDLNLQSVQVHFGAGEVDVDLSGKPSHDYDVNISGGVGHATVRVPEGVGVRADAHGGIGRISVTGLENRGDHYENSQYGHSNVNVRLRVEGGIGEIRIIG
jgi:N-terminal domain of toast_rack, DUF2154